MNLKLSMILTAALLSGCSFNFNTANNANSSTNTNANTAKPAPGSAANSPTPDAKASQTPAASKTSKESGGTRISFGSGGNSATLNGAVVRGDTATYLVTAKEGQTMTVKISSTEDNAVFKIEDSDGEFLEGAGDEDDAKTFKGELPDDGDYKIIVGGTRGNATYKLTVTIK